MPAWNDLDTAYKNGPFIPHADTYPPAWARRSAALRAQCGDSLIEAIPYGSAERQKLDLFLPKATPRGLFVFVHGGYWISFGRESWSYLAAGALARGWACCIPSYTLAPQASITQITQEIAQSIAVASRRVPGPVVVSGHSAGGHLAARMACVDHNLAIARAIPISPLAELEPLIETQMQSKLQLTPEECELQSPARLSKKPGIDVHVVVGANERPAFLWQARLLSENWACPWTALPGKHHFDVIDDLALPDSPLLQLCLDGLAP